MKPLKIFYVTDNWLPNIGGLESSTQYLISALRDRFGIELLTHCATMTPGAHEPTTDSPVQVRRFSASSKDGYHDQAYEYIASFAEHHTILVHVFGFSYFWPQAQARLVRNLKKIERCRVVLKVPTSGHPRRYIIDEFDDVKNVIDAYIALTGGIRNELLQCGIDESKIRVLPNGVPTDRFHPVSKKDETLARRLGLPQNRTLVVFAGRFTQQKRIDVLIRAITATPAEQRPCLVLVGFTDHTYDDGFETDSHLSKDIIVVPTQRDMNRVYGMMDAYVSTSQAEGMPNAVLEAMSCGLPVIASDIPGHIELIAPGENGWLFPEGNWHALSEILAGMSEEKRAGGLQIMGKRSREIIMNSFAMDLVAEQYINLYDILLSSSS